MKRFITKHGYEMVIACCCVSGPFIGMILSGGCNPSAPSAPDVPADQAIIVEVPAYNDDQDILAREIARHTDISPDPSPTPAPTKPKIGDICPECNGRGKSGDGIQPCHPCGGNGKVDEGDPILNLDSATSQETVVAVEAGSDDVIEQQSILMKAVPQTEFDAYVKEQEELHIAAGIALDEKLQQLTKNYAEAISKADASLEAATGRINELEASLRALEKRVDKIPFISPSPSKTAPVKPATLSIDDLSADEQPTPMVGVMAALDALKLQPNDILVDFGCGFDARFLITAIRYRRIQSAIGVEIDPEIADSARRYVNHAGLSDRIQIINGDATKVGVEADVGVAYLWPKTLAAIKPQIEKLRRFVSYAHAVPGLTMQPQQINGGGVIHVWERSPIRVPVTRTVRKTVRLPQGSWCQVCGRNCSNPMAHQLQRQIIGYQPATGQSSSPSRGHWETRRVCNNGICRNVQVWVAD